jgi:integrase
MTATKITITSVKKLADTGGWIWDSEVRGFGARKQTRDVFYYLRYRLDGRQYMRRIGRHGSPWTPETSRQTARVGLGEVAQGKHPTFGNGPKAEGDTFGDLVPRFLDRKRPELRRRTFTELARHLLHYAAPLNGLRLAEIDKRTIADHLDAVEKATGGVTRNRVRVSLSAFWNWANRQALAEGNPVRGTDTAKERRRDRVLSDSELAQVWKALPARGYGDIIKLLILTGQRREEMGHLRWSEVDLAKGVIKLGPERTKNKHQHEVPLSGMARSILGDRRSLSMRSHPQTAGAPNGKAEGDFVFGRFTAWSTAKASLDQRLPGMPPWTIHDLRRTCATGLGNLRVRPHVIETVLNHRGGHKAGVAGTYNYSAYPEEVREALDLWSRNVAEIVGEGLASPAAAA